MFYDSYYILFFLPAFLLAVISQIWISASYAKNSKVSPGTGITGKEAGEKILNEEGFSVDIEIEGKALSDHFDPSRDIVKLSNEALKSSVADIAVTAHEFGHVQQKFTNSWLFNLRMGLVPIVNIGSRVGYILILLGLFLNFLQLAEIGIFLFAGTTFFALITIPIELDATRKGLAFIRKYRLIEDSKISNAKSVLNAAAMTYIASLLTSLLNLFYYISLVRNRS